MISPGPALEYFRAIEDEFIRLRITPLLMSPDDFRIAKGWFEGGIPLDLVLSTLAEVVARHRDRPSEIRRRLSYYRAAVEAAWQTQANLAAGSTIDSTSGADIDAKLESLADSLTGFPEAAEAIRQLKGDANAEVGLQAIELNLLEKATANLNPDQRALVEEELASAIQVLSGRLSGRGLTKAAKSLRAQIVRRFLAIPRLSLFAAVG